MALTVSLRPRLWKDLIGQQDHVEELKVRFASGNVPHFYIFAGGVGQGKGSLASILATALQKDPTRFVNISAADYDTCPPPREINAADKTSVEDMRQLIQDIHFKPLSGKCKVIILDEAHQLSKSAQDALLKDTEDTPEHAFLIFCTSNISKITPALRSRACIFHMNPLNVQDTTTLVKYAAKSVAFKGEIEPLVKVLNEHAVSSPRCIIQAAERYFCGRTAHEAVLAVKDVDDADTITLCRAISKGCWKEASAIMSKMGRLDVVRFQAAVLAYLGKVLLSQRDETKAMNICRAIQHISHVPTEEYRALPAFMAAVGMACECIHK